MTPASITYLDEYKNACETLKGEIALAIQDLRFIENNGKLRYAVDFSEIFAYVLPSESFRDFIIFPDAFDDKDEIADATALQQLVLRYIFFDLSADPKLVLLPPYILEFRTFVQSLQRRLFINSVNRTLQVFDDLEKIIDDNTDKDVDIICQKIEKPEAYTVSDEEAKSLANFVQKYGYVQSFLESGEDENHPFQRVKQLRPDIAFSQLNDLFPQPLSSETNVYDRWVTDLHELRQAHGKISSTELDATAINLVYQVNQNLGQDTRLILITRSESMHELYQKELREGMWAETGEYALLRHPRVFSVALAVAQKSNSDDIQDLIDLNETLDLFLESYKIRNPNEPANDDTLINQIIKIKQGWKRIQKTAFPLSSKTMHSGEDSTLRNVTKARAILEYVRNDQDVKKKIVKILDGLFYDIDFAHDVLGLQLQLPFRTQDRKNKYESPPLLSFLSTSHTVNLYTTAGKNILGELSEKQEIGLEDIIKTFKKVFEQDGSKEKQKEDYERNLAMAFLLGTLIAQWQIAENYCLRAIKIGTRAGIATHEAMYYQALCKREAEIANLDQKISENWLSELLNLFDIAIESAEKFGLDNHSIARYWVEKGVSILIFYKKYRKQSDKTPTGTEALKLLEQWDEKLEDNLPLRLFILRTELNYLVADKRFRELPRIKSKFVLLENQLMQLESDVKKWPPYVADVMAWGKWVCFRDKFREARQRWKLVKRLKEAMEIENNTETRDEIYHHMKDVERG